MASRTQTAEQYESPSGPSAFHRPIQHHNTSKKKPWQTRRRSSFKAARPQGPDPEEERLSRETSRRTTQSTKRTPKWWKIRLFRGMIGDVKRRAPYYWSDWKDAWDYRVVPATVYMYFAKYESTIVPSIYPISSVHHNIKSACTMPILKRISKNRNLTGDEDFAYRSYSILPALAFSLDMFVKTNNSYGVNEVLLASVLGCVVFSLLAAQPLVIVGVTGKSSIHPAESALTTCRTNHGFLVHCLRYCDTFRD